MERKSFKKLILLNPLYRMGKADIITVQSLVLLVFALILSCDITTNNPTSSKFTVTPGEWVGKTSQGFAYSIIVNSDSVTVDAVSLWAFLESKCWVDSFYFKIVGPFTINQHGCIGTKKDADSINICFHGDTLEGTYFYRGIISRESSRGCATQTCTIENGVQRCITKTVYLVPHTMKNPIQLKPGFPKNKGSDDFTPVPVFLNETVKDIDGNIYKVVKIGTQVWTVENLRATKYNDGTPIPGPTFTVKEWAGLTTGAYSYYNNDSIANAGKYGALYNWYAVNTGKLAPEGWRVPTKADWDTLQNYLIVNGYNWDGSKNGNKIAKALAAKTDWVSAANNFGSIGNDLSINNTSGFSALPGGYRGGSNGIFDHQRSTGYWWSTTDGGDGAWYRELNYNYENLNIGYLYYKSCGLSVRLLRDVN